MDSNSKGGIVTRSGGRRLRWLAAAVAVPLFGGVAAFGTVHQESDAVPLQLIVEPLSLSPAPIGESGLSIYFREAVSRRNEAPAALLGRLGADEADAETIRHSPRAMRPFRLLPPGTTVQAKVDQAGKLRSLWYLTDRDTVLSLDRLGDGFQTLEQQVELTRGIEMKSGEIRTSLFAATRSAVKRSCAAARRRACSITPALSRFIVSTAAAAMRLSTVARMSVEPFIVPLPMNLSPSFLDT